MATVVEDLIRKLMDDQVVTKTEFSQTIHQQTLDLFKQFGEERKQYQQEQDRKYEQLQAQFRNDFQDYKKEARAQTRWLIGIGVTLILGIAAILIRLHS